MQQQVRWVSVLSAMVLCSACTLRDAAWSSIPETSAYRATATHAQVLEALHWHARQDARLQIIHAGLSGEGRDLAAVIVADPPLRTLAAAAADPRPKALIVGSIHPGECEGKEAILEILRALTRHEHDAWLRECAVVFLPDYNADGTDAVHEKSREQQAGPSDGCGRRETSTGLDLNRDFTKAEASETRALLRLLRELDPLLLVDCHTTNGSYHGFDLTWAGPLSPATDKGILQHTRKVLLPEIRAALAARGMLSFDYGNWRGNWWPDEPPRAWETFDHLPRYVTNGVGVRNRFSVLSEAYVHRPFIERIASTRALITAALDHFSREHRTLAALAEAADRNAAALAAGGSLCLDGRLTASGMEPIPSSSVIEKTDPLTQRRELHHSGRIQWVLSETSVHFEGTLPVSVPWGFAFTEHQDAVRAVLDAHGISSHRLESAVQVHAEALIPTRIRRANRAFQGHHLTSLQAQVVDMECPLAAGTLIVPCAQPLARLVVLLCEPRSPDGFIAWETVSVPPGSSPQPLSCWRLKSPPVPPDK